MVQRGREREQRERLFQWPHHFISASVHLEKATRGPAAALAHMPRQPHQQQANTVPEKKIVAVRLAMETLQAPRACWAQIDLSPRPAPFWRLLCKLPATVAVWVGPASEFRGTWPKVDDQMGHSLPDSPENPPLQRRAAGMAHHRLHPKTNRVFDTVAKCAVLFSPADGGTKKSQILGRHHLQPEPDPCPVMPCPAGLRRPIPAQPNARGWNELRCEASSVRPRLPVEK